MNKHKGFSIIELMVVVAIVGIVASIAMPAFMKLIERNRLKAAVQAAQNDFQHARTLAIKQNKNVLLRWMQTSTTAGDWCYGLSTTPNACNCTQAQSATNCDIKIVSGQQFNTVSMFSATSFTTFDFKRGTATARGVIFNTDHYAARVTTSGGGRVLICKPVTAEMPASNTLGLPGISNCN